MIILFDLVTPQSFIGGAGEYIRRVFYELLNITHNNSELKLLCAIDSSINKYAYKDLSFDVLTKKKLEIVDLAHEPLSIIISNKCVDKLFIGAAQYWGERYDVFNVNCKVICVIHDLQDEECTRNNIYQYVLPKESIKAKTKKIIHSFFIKSKDKKSRLSFVPVLYRKGNLKIITVSNYSKHSIMYNLDINKDSIKILYSPERIIKSSDNIDNIDLLRIINNNTKYFLLLSGNRPLKNASKVLAAFRRFCLYSPDPIYIVTTGIKKSMYSNHIALPYLSDSDLTYVVKNCHAMIFPSYFEGFGYPPVEAMGYGKPILASNTTSIPEICGNAPIYFSPFYETDIFSAFMKFDNLDYDILSKKSKEQYYIVNKKQEQDLETLLQTIIE